MKHVRDLIIATALFIFPLNAPLATAVSDPKELIKAATTRPWPGESYPALPSLSSETQSLVIDEIRSSQAVRSAYAQLDAASRSNVDWFEGVAALEKQKALWSLLSCLIHPSEDVQINALRSLERMGDKRAVHFLLIYAEYMAVDESGSENATIHGIIHKSIAQTLSALTGMKVTLKGQDPEGLKRGIKIWRKWLAERDPTPDNPFNRTRQRVAFNPLQPARPVELRVLSQAGISGRGRCAVFFRRRAEQRSEDRLERVRPHLIPFDIQVQCVPVGHPLQQPAFFIGQLVVDV